MELLISRRTPLLPSLLSEPVSQGALKATLQTALRREQSFQTPRTRTQDAEVSLVLCDDAFIRELNAQYRGQDKPTDVLSFGQEEDCTEGSGPRILGDIVISLPTADRHAARAGWLVESEITLLVVHGLLHLLGHDDETDEGAREMQVRTLETLAACGVELPAAGIHPFFAEHG